MEKERRLKAALKTGDFKGAMQIAHTRRLMLILSIAPFVLLFFLLLVLVVLGMPIGFGRLLILATFSGVAGALIPLMVLQFKANRTRKRMEEQFPVAVDVFVREPLDFRTMLANAVIKELDNVPIPVASIPHLIALKQVAGRPLDLDDIRALRDIAADTGQEST